jgi:hypothetical protein
MGLRVEIPEDFKPVEPNNLKEFEERDVQYWIYTNDGTAKKYKDATAEETYEFIESLSDHIPVKDSSRLGLMVIKAAVTDIVLNIAIFYHRNLFGGPEYWESLEEWQRISTVIKKDNEKE